MRRLTAFLFYKLMGWTIVGTLPPDIKKAVIIVVPHTSWHDFYLGAFVRKIIGLPIHFIGKKELFSPPFGWYFRWMGSSPVDRSARSNMVEQAVDLFKEKEEFRLALAPEGTRKKVNQWRTGFYYIAHKAGVPIISVAFDYGTKTVKIALPFYTTGTIGNDLPKIKSFYKGVVGKVAAYT